MKSAEVIHLFLKIMLHIVVFCKTNFVEDRQVAVSLL